MVGLHTIGWNVLHVRDFVFTHHWKLRVGCKNMQTLSICEHEENNDPKFMEARWEALHFPSPDLVFITRHVCASSHG